MSKRKYPENVTKNMSNRTEAELEELKRKYSDMTNVDAALDILAERMTQVIIDKR